MSSNPPFGHLKPVFIINPTAGRGQAGRKTGEVSRRLREYGLISPVWRYTQASGDALRLTRQAAAEGANLVVAVGGDGTLHEVVNGLLGTQAALGVIPFGTGNDFARALNIYGDLDKACRAIVLGETRPVDIGTIDGAGNDSPKHFLAIAGAGFDACTARTVNEGIKHLSGAAAYVWGAVLTAQRFQPFRFTLTLDDEPVRQGTAMFISVANTPTTGGGMKIAPGAQIDDGLFDICLVREVPKLQLLWQLTKVFQGAHVNHPAVTMLRASRVKIEADPPQPLLIDGEVCGTTPASVTIQRQDSPCQGRGGMTSEWDVVIPAGGSIPESYARVIGTPYRALAPLGPDRRPVLQVVINALQSCGLVRRIIVVGPEAIASQIDGIDLWLPPGASGADNALRGLTALGDPTVQALVCTSDLPLLTAEAVRCFVMECRPDADIALGLVGAAEYERAFPKAPPSQWVTLRDTGPVTSGGLFSIRPSCLLERSQLLTQVFSSRKSQWRMARMLGPELLWRWTTRSLTLTAIQARGEAMLGARAQILRDVSPQLSFDIDTEDDYTYADTRLRQCPRHDAAGQI